jgi:hypothetical protein
VTANRPEHNPDSIGDFIGLNQNKWSNLNGECDGNIDGFSFVFWDPNGDKRSNYQPQSATGAPVPDIPSGLGAWTRFRGYEADSFSQLTDFNPAVPAGHGFTFADLKAEIDAGYPVLLFLQSFDQLSRSMPGMPRANPDIHGMLAYGYYLPDDGDPLVRYKTSWGSSGDYSWSRWNAGVWQAQMPLRGVIGYHPSPKITQVLPTPTGLQLQWEGPSSVMVDLTTRITVPLHWYVVEKSTTLRAGDFEAVSSPTSDRSVTLTNCCPDEVAFYRLKIVPPPAGSPP